MSTANSITSFAVQYQLERNHRPFRREAIRQLQANRCGVYALWICVLLCLFSLLFSPSFLFGSCVVLCARDCTCVYYRDIPYSDVQ